MREHFPQDESEAKAQQIQNPKDYLIKKTLFEYFESSPIPPSEKFAQIALFLDRRTISRFLFINEIYEKILDVHGVIMEFGVRYGANLALLLSLRGIYEPYNHNRKIIGFDTFQGFPVLDNTKDPHYAKIGDFGVTKDYEEFLEQVLYTHEKMSPLEQIKKFELVKGDASHTLRSYLEKNQQTIISFAYFDLDVYIPTKECLSCIIPYLNRGAIIGFDEINDPNWPGETIALREVLGTNKYKIIHSKYRANAAYLIFE